MYYYEDLITFVYDTNNDLWNNRILSDICHNDLLTAVHNKNNRHVLIFDLFVALYFINDIFLAMDDKQISYYATTFLFYFFHFS